MRILISAFLLFSFCLSSSVKAEPSPWQLKENKDGIPVYTRKVEGSAILEYKANVVVNAPITKAIALFEDETQIPHWYFQCVHSELVANENPKQKIIYLILHLPWPVASRDFVFRRTRTEDPSKGMVSYSLTALPDRLPPVKGMVRVNSIESLWSFKSLAQGQTEVFFQQHTDPGGNIPASIINELAILTPFNSLKNFRRLINGKDA